MQKLRDFPIKKFSLLIVAIAACSISLTTYAEIPIPRIDPARFTKHIEQQEIKAPVAKPKQLRPTPAKIPPKADQIKFFLKKIILKGNTIYDQQGLAPLYSKYLHKKISLKDLYNITHSITMHYRHHGYILSRAIVPPQKIKTGMVTIRIIEGYIDNYTIKGDAGIATHLLKNYLEHIKDSRPLSNDILERYTLLANDIPGLNVRLTLAPSKTQTGASHLIVIVKHKTYNASINYDNYGTKYIGPQQLFATFNINNKTLMPGDLGLVAGMTPTSNELRFIQANWLTIWDQHGLEFRLGASHVKTNPAFVLEPNRIAGLSTSWDAEISYPWIRSRRTNLSTSIKFVWIDSKSDIPDAPIFNDHIRTVRFGAKFDHIDTHRGITNGEVTLSQGLKTWGASNAEKPSEQTSRPAADPAYTKLNINISRLQQLNNYFALLFGAHGQYSFDSALLSAEEFDFGGWQLGRGYDPSEITGDNGLSGKAELMLTLNPEKKWLNQTQFYIFYDIGKIWNIGEINGQPEQLSASSTGGGIRLLFTKNLFVNFMVGKPLTLPVATSELSGDNGKHFRYFFGVNLSF